MHSTRLCKTESGVCGFQVGVTRAEFEANEDTFKTEVAVCSVELRVQRAVGLCSHSLHRCQVGAVFGKTAADVSITGITETTARRAGGVQVKAPHLYRVPC